MKLFQFSKKNKNFVFFPKISKKILSNKLTPFFYTDIPTIQNRYQQIQQAFLKNWSGENIIAFSFKTNYPIIKKIRSMFNISAEVVSDMEYKKAKKLKFSNSKIIYNGPNKININKLIKCRNIIINIDNQLEIENIIKNKDKIKCQIGIRLNTTLKKSRFGFNIENGSVKKVIDQLQKNQIKINGLSIHLGFYSRPKLYYQISKKIIKLIKENHLQLNYIDFGGGFPSHGLKPYGFKKYAISSIDKYINQICSPLNIFYKRNINKPILIVEPGRFLVDDSTSLITKIVNQQIINDKQIITVEATNQILSSVWFRPQVVKPVSIKNKPEVNTIIYGGSCQEDDILYQGQFPIIKINSPIVFYCVGAYNQNMCPNFIYSKPKTYFNITNKKNKN